MKILVTGATGFIGIHLCRELVRQGYIVNALYRSRGKAEQIKHKNIHLFKGDVTDTLSIRKAIKECDFVFHLAACAQVWSKDPCLFYEINYKGTLNVLNEAEGAGIKKIVVTSTAGVFGPSDGKMVDENTKRQTEYFTLYEKTKAEAEELILNRTAKGMNIVIVNPTRVYGPGLLNISNSVTRIVRLYTEGKFRFLPGNGKSIGNYVFIDDVVAGHILALEKGVAGERYILGGENISYAGFFKVLAEISGKSYLLFRFPLNLMLFVSFIMLMLARSFGIKPLITPGLVRKYNYNWVLSSNKAQSELGYKITPLKSGITETLKFIYAEKTENEK
jgi:nucleoside-diphosphate-sugar epimerase